MTGPDIVNRAYLVFLPFPGGAKNLYELPFPLLFFPPLSISSVHLDSNLSSSADWLLDLIAFSSSFEQPLNLLIVTVLLLKFFFRGYSSLVQRAELFFLASLFLSFLFLISLQINSGEFFPDHHVCN